MKRQKSNVKYSFGFDPGINHAAWAIVGTDGSMLCGLIKNPYKIPKGEKLDSWAKLHCMVCEVEKLMLEVKCCYPKCDVWVVEGQYAARGRGTPDHQIRNGWIAAACYARIPGANPLRYIAIPAVWTENKPKELRHPDLLSKLAPQEDWVWPDGKIPSGELMHNVIDSAGLAVWGFEQNNISMER